MSKLLGFFVILFVLVSVSGVVLMTSQVKDLNLQLTKVKELAAKPKPQEKKVQTAPAYTLDLPKLGVKLTSTSVMESPQVIELPGHTKIVFPNQTLDFYTSYSPNSYVSLVDWWQKTKPQDYLEFCPGDDGEACRPYLASELNIDTNLHLPDRCGFGTTQEISVSAKVPQEEGFISRSNYFLLDTPNNLIFRLNHDEGGGDSGECEFGFGVQRL